MIQIEGVKIIDCKKVQNDRGFLQEVLRNDDEYFATFGQVYLTHTLREISKAWYKHDLQTDFIFVVNGTMKIGLQDDRKESPTYNHTLITSICSSSPQLIKIPPGIWHGFKAERSDLLLMHINSLAINFEQKDEHTLPLSNNRISIQL